MSDLEPLFLARSEGERPQAPGPDLLILGELVVRSGGRDVALPGPSVRALLSALLLTAGEVVGEDRLLELAWEAEKGSRRALQCAVHRLRGWLGRLATGCRLEYAGTGYRLVVPGGAVDLGRFQELLKEAAAAQNPERALDLLSLALGQWRGPVLGGRPEWLAVHPLVRAIEQARVECAAAVADLAFRLNRHDVVPLVGEVAALAPYDEPLQARFVRLLARAGRHAEALRHVEEVRRRLADDLGIAPSREVRSAHAVALQGEVPMQLPPGLPDFTGRAAETAAVTEPLLSGREPRAALVFAINGPPGVGKTALALEVAHRMAALFADGQLYADLRDQAGRPVAPDDVLARFLRSLGHDSVPGSMEDRVALYRSRTAGRRVLVILDNAAEEAQVRPLVPGSSGSAVLVTSRVCLAGLAGARLLRLGMLAQDEAVRLLVRVSGRDGLAGDPAVGEIARLCDLLPLAVRIAGIRLAGRPSLRPGGLARLLRKEDRRLDELAVHGLAVRPSLDAAYRDLAPAHRQAFRLLGRFGGAFTAQSAAACLGVSPDSAAAYLEALVDAGLLEAAADYRLHDLIRLYAREPAPD
ncbi:winged helix-turn-helix domain-containing protein [Actinomadura barringtoniae]|uniref:Winged helix-turn-helix domain-containing protein n=1 Tax=Actinomadura barringtoniae TaxID=1427535 RepID=A0A939PDV5_9ACTN|nr:BTAD domain-containing putative transcriptional regulator [Actinomadura barringtoniae]MBO2450800.1 winged helix-turn-helix domain-containing protein [Actinomadura barringtoniae]